MVNWKPDVILASAMPYTSLLVAAKLSRKYDIPFVAELRDLWVDNHYIKHNPLSTVGEESFKSGICDNNSISAIGGETEEKVR